MSKSLLRESEFRNLKRGLIDRLIDLTSEGNELDSQTFSSYFC